MTVTAQVRINRHGAERVESGHPWIFASDVTDRGEARPGDAVRVVNAQGRNMGTAHYSASSQITLRMLSRKVEEVNADFWRDQSQLVRSRINSFERFAQIFLDIV